MYEELLQIALNQDIRIPTHDPSVDDLALLLCLECPDEVAQYYPNPRNRDRYKAAHEDVTRLLTYLRELDLPGNGETAHSDFEQIIDLWVRTFCDPNEMERKLLEQNDSLATGETEKERHQRETQEFVRNHYLR